MANMGSELAKQKAAQDAKDQQATEAKTMKALFDANNPTSSPTALRQAPTLVLPSEKTGRGIVVPAPSNTPASTVAQTKMGKLPSLAELNDIDKQPSLADLHSLSAPLDKIAVGPATGLGQVGKNPPASLTIPTKAIEPINSPGPEVVTETPERAPSWHPTFTGTGPLPEKKDFGSMLGELLKGGGDMTGKVLMTLAKAAQAYAAGASGHPEQAVYNQEREQANIDAERKYRADQEAWQQSNTEAAQANELKAQEWQRQLQELIAANEARYQEGQLKLGNRNADNSARANQIDRSKQGLDKLNGLF